MASDRLGPITPHPQTTRRTGETARAAGQVWRVRQERHLMSNNKMLIDASHEEETRVVVLKQGRVQEFDFEAAARKLLKGSIYLAKITRVEPSLQAAFVDFGGNRHGFLAFNEIHPDYYQIPVADREALLAEQAAERARLDAEDDADAGLTDSSDDEEDEDTDGEVIEIDEPLDDADDDEDDSDTADETTSQAIDASAEADDDSDDVKDTEAPDRVALPELDDAVVDIAEAAAIDVSDLLPPDESDSDDDAKSDDETGKTSDIALKTAADDVQKSAPVEPSETDDEREIEADADPSQDSETAEVEARARRTDDGENADDANDEGDAGADDDDSDDDGDADETDNANATASPRKPRQRRNARGSNGSNGTRAPRRRMRHYKIQEVIKRRQIVLVQVVKEERGNKGAALTTYLSLAGRYTVLMPNTARGGGISRKITNAADRKRLKSVVQDLDVPEGMGLIVRTAGAARTKQEIKRDFEYLLRLWETVRDLTLRSKAPALVYEEGNLIKRAIRDLYSKEIDEVVVSGQNAHRSAKDFMRMLMPSHAKNVVKYDEPVSLFKRYGIENQLNALFSPIVTLPSGGYLVINQTEALVAIDINSGRSTREFSIEETAYKTNLEAAEEIARQLKLRDLAGLVVIDFIDMDEKRNNRGVERKLKEALKSDRARIQVGRISHFGLLEMSRQRLRTGMLEGSTTQCSHCQGTGIIRSVESIALGVLRGIEDAIEPNGPDLLVKTAPHVAFYLLNQKRQFLTELEDRCDVSIEIVGSHEEQGANFKVETVAGDPAKRPSARRAKPAAISVDHGFADFDDTDEPDNAPVEAETDDDDGENSDNGRGGSRRRRRRRGGRRDDRGQSELAAADGDDDDASSDDETSDDEPRGRRRGRRGGQRNRGRGRNGHAAFEAPAEYDLDPSEFEEILGASAEIYIAQAKTVASAAAAARRRMVNGRRHHDEGDDADNRRGGNDGGRGRNDRAAQARTIASAAATLETPDIGEGRHDVQASVDGADTSDAKPRRSRRRRGGQRKSDAPEANAEIQQDATGDQDAVTPAATVETIAITEDGAEPAGSAPVAAATDDQSSTHQQQPDEVDAVAVDQVGTTAQAETQTEVSDEATETQAPIEQDVAVADNGSADEKPARRHWGEQAASEPVVHRVIVSSNDANGSDESQPEAAPPQEKPQRKGWWQRNFG
jgi:ribonuclease E